MADRSSPDTLLIRDIVQAAIELACIRHDLCFYDEPPLVVEQCAEIVTDVFNALRGIDTCDPEPCPEFSAILAALEDRQEAAPERRPPFCNYAIVPVASGGFLHCNDSSGHGGEHSWRGPWTVYENYGGVPSEAIPSKEYTQWQGDRVVAIGEKEARIWDTEILPVGWGMPKEISYTLPPVGTPQKETPTMPYGAGAQNFGAVPEGVQGKEPQTFEQFWKVEKEALLARVVCRCSAGSTCDSSAVHVDKFAKEVFVSGEAAGRRSATLLEKDLFGALKAILATVGAADYDDVQLVDTSAIERAKTIVACAELHP